MSIFFNIVLILGFVLPGCKSEPERSKNLITVALGAPPFSIDPLKATDATGMRLTSLIYQGLVRIGSDLKPQPDLAYKWTVQKSDYTFYIRNSLKFSDGSDLKCRHILKSIKLYQSDKTPFKAAFSPIEDEKCQERGQDLILSFSLPQPSAKFLTADLPVLKIFKNDLGTGAFQSEEFNTSLIQLKPNTYFPNPQNYSVLIYFLKDDFSRFLKTYKGEIDIAPNSIPFEKIDSFKDTDFKVMERPSLSSSYLLVNHKNKNLKDLTFRKELFTSIGVEDLIENRFQNHVTRSKSLLSPEHPYFASELKNLSIEAPEKKTVTQIKPLILKTSNARQSIETGKIIAQKLRDRGLPTQLQSFEWGTFYRDIKSGNYDLALMKWVGVIDPDQYNVAFHSKEFPPGRNRGYYKDISIDKLLDEAQVEIDFSRRKKLYDQVQIQIFKDLAIFPLWHENQIHIVHPRIQGYTVNPMGDFSNLIDLKIKELKDE